MAGLAERGLVAQPAEAARVRAALAEYRDRLGEGNRVERQPPRDGE